MLLPGAAVIVGARLFSARHIPARRLGLRRTGPGRIASCGLRVFRLIFGRLASGLRRFCLIVAGTAPAGVIKGHINSSLSLYSISGSAGTTRLPGAVSFRTSVFRVRKVVVAVQNFRRLALPVFGFPGQRFVFLGPDVLKLCHGMTQIVNALAR